jgi:hypothetical protein
MKLMREGVGNFHDRNGVKIMARGLESSQK